MAREILNNLVTYGEQRTKINSNFEELYNFEANTIQDFSIHNIYVTQDGSDITGDGRVNNPYKTIKYALSQITDNDVNNRYVINLTGVFLEDNPIQLKSYVTLVGIGGSIATRIEANNVGQDLFLNNVTTEVRGVALKNTTGKVIELVGSSPTIFRDVTLLDCLQGFLINDPITKGEFFDIACVTESITKEYAIKVEAGSVNIRNFTIVGNASITHPIWADGSTSFLNLISYVTSSPNIGTGLYASNSGSISFSTIGVLRADYGLRAVSGGSIKGSAFSIEQSQIFDIFQEDDSSTFNLSGGTIDANKLAISNFENVRTLVSSTTEGDPANVSTRELHVGTSELGRETCLGEGDSTARGMLVYSYDGASFTDVSNIARSVSGSTFSFPTTAGSGFYCSSDLIDHSTQDYKKFFGLKTIFSTPMSQGTGSYVWEYWNGSSWINFNIMLTMSDPPYLSKAKVLDAITGSTQIRFASDLAGTSPPFNNVGGWQKNDPVGSGTPRYWIRFRIVEDITTAPNIEQIKLHSNRTEANSDGWMEYFGTARPTNVLPLDFALSSPATLSAQAPQDVTVFLSDTIFIERKGNGFRNNRVDLTSFNTLLPPDVDTSTTILLLLTYVVEASTTGAVDWVVRYATSRVGDGVFFSEAEAPTTVGSEKEVTLTDTIPTNGEKKQRTVGIELDVSDSIFWDNEGNSDLLWIQIARDGNNDTFQGQVNLINILARYIKWNNGSRFITV